MDKYIDELKSLEEKIKDIIISKKERLHLMEYFKDLEFNEYGSPIWKTHHATKITLYAVDDKDTVGIVLKNDYGMYVNKKAYIDIEHKIWNARRDFGKLWNKIEPQLMSFVNSIKEWQQSKPGSIKFNI